MEVGPTTHYMMGGVQVDGDIADVDVPGLVRRGRMRRRVARRESAGRQFAFRSAGVRQARRRVRREVREGQRSGAGESRGCRCRGQGGSGAVRTRSGGRESVHRAERAAGHDAGPGRHRAHGKRDAAGARQDRRPCARARPRPGSRAISEYNTGWHTALDLDNMLSISEIDRARRASSARKAAAGTSATIIRRRAPSGASTTCRSSQGVRTGSPKVERVPVVPLTDEMKQVIEEKKK